MPGVPRKLPSKLEGYISLVASLIKSGARTFETNGYLFIFYLLCQLKFDTMPKMLLERNSRAHEPHFFHFQGVDKRHVYDSFATAIEADVHLAFRPFKNGKGNEGR